MIVGVVGDIDRRYLQAFVKDGGWLYKTPCTDCAKNEEGGDKQVMEVVSLLKLKGQGELGYYCNCGPNGHKMIEADEPAWSQTGVWSCNLILCINCVNRRMLGMGETKSSRRRRQKTIGF
jgi:hypothetical protein